jgi:tripartite-type tricarboxylate transporter receptor subunit TctC
MTHEIRISRRTVLGAAAALFAASPFAQGSGKLVTLICPFTPGGTADSQLRALAAAVSKPLGQTVVVDNRAGAAGTIGPGSLVGAPPDGSMLSMATAIALLRQPFIHKTRYDPAKDFTYIIGVTRFELGLAVRADSPWQTLDDFIQDAKRQQGKVSFGTAGVATAQHTAMLQLGEKLGVNWTHVPYKGSGDVFNALAGGHVDAICETSGWAPFVDAGKFRLLAVFAENRLRRWPDVPTVKELGHGISESVPWGIVGPAGMASARVQALHDAFRKSLDDPGFTATLSMLGQEPWGIDSQAYRSYMLSRIPIERDLVNRYRLREQ